MKKLLIFIALFSGISQSVFAQINNRDAFAAINLCGVESYSQSFQSPKGRCNGTTTLYYHFKSETTTTNQEIGTFETESSSTYVLYGPFSSVEEGAEQLNTFTAPYVAYGVGATTHTIRLNTQENKVYILQVVIASCDGNIEFALDINATTCSNTVSCESCIPQFNPGPGKYILSAWVKEEGAPPTKTSYNQPSIVISFPSASISNTYTPSGLIIDGWQRIESIFEVPGGSGDITVKLQVASGNAFFDDIRIFPFDGSMISYVYDPLTLRLVAELDERNYAKIYEYDEEGKLTRVKKETEKGIMTIQENRENSVKKP